MEAFLSQIPENLPYWAWILGLLIVAVLTYLINKAKVNSKKQNNTMTGNTIKKSKINQRNNANDKES